MCFIYSLLDFFFVKQKTAYEMRISDWSSDVCSSDLRMAEVTPTVTALRQRAADVVEAELMRLDSRLPGLDDPQRDEVARTVRRVVDKLLHAPTVRVKQLASAPGGDSYAAALRELFELSPGSPAAVATPTRSEEHTSEL